MLHSILYLNTVNNYFDAISGTNVQLCLLHEFDKQAQL